MTKSILVVDDSFIMRTIIKDIVESDPELKVVGFAENGKIGLQKTRELKPDALILDLEMPEMSGIDMMKRLALVSKAKVIVVSSVDIIAKPSGAMSLDLQAKKGHEIVQALRRALGLDPAPSGND
jgi:two-component system chemotaxis response regulator CheB